MACTNEAIETRFVGYYEYPFSIVEDFESNSVTWDFHECDRFIGETCNTLVDVCAGNGRLSKRYFDGVKSLIAIDSSSERLASLRSWKQFSERTTDVELLELDLSKSISIEDICADKAIVGDVSINSFLSRSSLETLFSNCRKFLKPGGFLLIFCFSKQAIERLNVYKGEEFRVDNVNALPNLISYKTSLYFNKNTNVLNQKCEIVLEEERRYLKYVCSISEKMWQLEDVIQCLHNSNFGVSEVNKSIHNDGIFKGEVIYSIACEKQL